MSNNLNVSSSTSNTGTTANPQPSTKSNYQGQPVNSLQNNGATPGLNNTPRGGNTVPIKNFSLNSLAAQDHSSTTSANSSISSTAVAIIVVVVILAIIALFLANKGSRSKNITTKKA